MHSVLSQILIALVFSALSFVYFIFDFGQAGTDKIFITITTFIFSTFVGFFIARQSARYTKIREIISTFDGKLTACYRASRNVSDAVYADIGAIITRHYRMIIDTKQWNYHFTHKSTTISDVHAVLEKNIGDQKKETLRGQAIGRMLTALSDCQVLRKNMVMLFYERMVLFQWVLMLLFVVILIATISVVPSVGVVFASILKAAFVATIIAVVFILRDLDNLHLFESFAGENSARDVIGIIEGNR